ncbi:MAG: SDR family NAD(P)-dependent oxidoreductase [Planctomycetota bacterium]|jgi:3-oxoacyl-[acyl-carrier protein] reductase
MQIHGKVAVVTGAGTGVGRETAIKIARLGGAVVVNYSRSEEAANRVVADIESSGGRAKAHRADVAVDAEARGLIDEAIGSFGRLDILVNNAGTTEFIPFDRLDDVTDAAWDKIMGVNVRGPFHCTRAAVKAMRATQEMDGDAWEGGEVVTTSSVAGLIGVGSSIPYAASKAAVNNMTLSLARTLAPHIRVNAVAPGFISGDWLKDGLGDNYESIMAAFNGKLPLGRVCDPPDVADAILSLITGSDLVTGQVLTVDSGMTIMAPITI